MVVMIHVFASIFNGNIDAVSSHHRWSYFLIRVHTKINNRWEARATPLSAIQYKVCLYVLFIGCIKVYVSF